VRAPESIAPSVAVTFRAGAAATAVDPPLGLPLVGVVRRDEPGRERLGALEVTAVAFERGALRVVLCGVDTLAIQSPEVDAIRARVAERHGVAVRLSGSQLVDDLLSSEGRFAAEHGAEHLLPRAGQAIAALPQPVRHHRHHGAI